MNFEELKRKLESRLSKKQLAGLVLVSGVVVICLVGLLFSAIFGGDGDVETQPPEIENTDTTPTPMPEPTYFPEIEGNGELMEGDGVYSNTEYANNKVLTYKYNKTDSISVGVDAPDETGSIIINPHASVTDEGHRVAFYVEPSRCFLNYAHFPFEEMDSTTNMPEKNIVVNWVYNEATTGTYHSSDDYGISWVNSYQYDNQDHTGCTLAIRAVDLNESQLIAVCTATIIWNEDSKQYELASLTGNDVSDTGAMSSSDRADLLSRAYDLMLDENFGPNNSYDLTEDDKAELIEFGIVEKVPSTYFQRFISEYGTTAKSSKYAYDDIYAVSFKVGPWGFITMYYSPQASYLSDIEPGNPEEEYIAFDKTPVTSMDLKYFGHDPVGLYTRNPSLYPAGYFN